MSFELTQVCASIDGKPLLRDVTLSIQCGEVVAIVGANGAGKTSLLRLLSSDVAPSQGQITLEGASLTSLGSIARAQSIAVLPQLSTLDFPFKVGEVILMGRIPYGTSAARNKAVVQAVIARLGLNDLEHRIYTTLSGGERQQVQIARVICQLWGCTDPHYYLFDEPTAPLDLAHQLAFLELARELAYDQAGVLLVMHDVNLAARFADRIVLMRAGRILATGTPRDVITRSNVLETFAVDAEVSLTPDGAPFIYTRLPSLDAHPKSRASDNG